MADRTVSAQLRADVSAYIAAMRAAAAATRRLGNEAERAGKRANAASEQMHGSAGRLEQQIRQLAETERRQADETQRSSDETDRHRDSTERDTQAQDRNRRSTEQSTRGLTANRRTLVSLIAAGVGAGAAATSAGLAFGAFGVIAAGSIVKVVTAQQDMAGTWDTLTGRQKIAATSVRALTDDYKQLAQSYEPQTLAAFNQVIGTTRVLLPQVANLLDATSGDVLQLTNRLGEFVSGRVGGEFLTWAGQTAPEALDVLGTTMVTAGDTALDLIQDIAPLGIGLLQLTNGALGLVNGLANLNPMLAQLAVTGVMLRAPVQGIVTGVGNMTTRVRAASEATAGMSKRARALNLITAAGPNLYVAAGVALGFLALKLVSAKDSTDRFIEGLREARTAAGNNLAIYQQHAQLLQSRYVQAVQRSNEVTSQSESTFGAVSSEMKKTGDEARKVAQQYQFMTANGDRLAASMGITRDQALRMADAAGVNLATSVDKAGNLTAAAKAKIDQYAQSARLAADPTRAVAFALNDASNRALTLDARVKALTTAFDMYFTPTLAAFQATTRLRQGFRDLGDAADKSKASLDGHNPASIRLQQTFQQNVATVRDLHQAVFQKTRSMDAANAAVNRYLPVLYSLAGQNREARAAVDGLAQITGFQVSRTNVSRDAFIRQATAMLGNKRQAEQLWAAYRALQQQTGGVTSTTGQAITRVKTMAGEMFRLQVRTGNGTGAQRSYNDVVRNALPVLYAMAGRNKDAKAQVDRLAASIGVTTGKTNVSKKAFIEMASKMGVARDRAEKLWKELNKIKDRDVDVDVNAQGHWRMPGGLPGPGPFGRATGGPIPAKWAMGSGGPTEDDVPILASVGEHMWTAREVQNVGGHGAMERMRASARAGQFKGYASGGAIGLGSSGSNVGRVVQPVWTGYQGMITAMARSFAAQWKKYAASGGAALSWARTQAGKPYIWGGVGPAGYDCSGWTSAITNVIQKRSPHQRRHTTHSFGASGPDGFVRGLRSPFRVGVTDAGVGHMAGSIGNVAVESSGGAGVRVGGGARGASNSLFTRQYGLRMATGGALTEDARRIADRALRLSAARGEVALAATLGLVGDPSSRISPARPVIPGYAGGGWIRGRPGADRVPLAGTAGEYMVNRVSAAANGPLLEAVNAGLGEALLRRTVRAGLVRGGDGAAAGRGGATHITLELHNHGVIGSQLDVDNWLIKSLDRAGRQGRLPAALTRRTG